jgi:hypothetical protein
MKPLKLGLISLLAGALAIATPVATAAATSGGVRIVLTCETGPGGSGTFMVTANARSSFVTVRCGGSATVTNSAWMAGATATIHQTAAPAGAFLARNRTVTLATGVVTVFIRDFRKPSVPTLAQTGASPAAPLGLLLVGIALASVGGYLVFRRLA